MREHIVSLNVEATRFVKFQAFTGMGTVFRLAADHFAQRIETAEKWWRIVADIEQCLMVRKTAIVTGNDYRRLRGQRVRRFNVRHKGELRKCPKQTIKFVRKLWRWRVHDQFTSVFIGTLCHLAGELQFIVDVEEELYFSHCKLINLPTGQRPLPRTGEGRGEGTEVSV